MTPAGCDAVEGAVAHTPVPALTAWHIHTAVQALAYLVALSSVTKRPSAFDEERELALIALRDHGPDLLRQLAALRQREAELLRALDTYGWHKHKCAAITDHSADMRDPDVACDCGYDAALAKAGR